MLDLVTGGAGFIGSHLVDRLLTEGRRVRVLDNFVVGRRANLDQHAGNHRLEIIECDVADKPAVMAACGRPNISDAMTLTRSNTGVVNSSLRSGYEA